MAISYGTKSGDTFWDLRGKREDTKPVTGVPNGSTFTEINNGGQKFYFDAEDSQWNPETVANGGGAVAAGVASFNNRSGAVMPQAGDYTADMVGADPAGNAAQALTDAKIYTDTALTNYTVTVEFAQAVDTAVEEALQNSITEADPGAIDALFP